MDLIQSYYDQVIDKVSNFMSKVTDDEIAEVYDVSAENLYMQFITNKNIKVVKYYKTIQPIGEPIDINNDNTLYLRYEIKPIDTDIISIYTTKRQFNPKRFLQVGGLDIDVISTCYKPVLLSYPLDIYVKIDNQQQRPRLTYECYLLSNDYRTGIVHMIL
jgi:hypothetical protein